MRLALASRLLLQPRCPKGSGESHIAIPVSTTLPKKEVDGLIEKVVNPCSLVFLDLNFA
jgi:hypothetical protein